MTSLRSFCNCIICKKWVVLLFPSNVLSCMPHTGEGSVGSSSDCCNYGGDDDLGASGCRTVFKMLSTHLKSPLPWTLSRSMLLLILQLWCHQCLMLFTYCSCLPIFNQFTLFLWTTKIPFPWIFIFGPSLIPKKPVRIIIHLKATPMTPYPEACRNMHVPLIGP